MTFKRDNSSLIVNWDSLDRTHVLSVRRVSFENVSSEQGAASEVQDDDSEHPRGAFSRRVSDLMKEHIPNIHVRAVLKNLWCCFGSYTCYSLQ